MGAARSALRRQGPPSALEDDDLRGRAPARPDRSTLAAGGADRRRELSDLRRESARTHAARRRRRHHGQSRQSQGQSRSPAHPLDRRQALLPAEILSRPQSHRTGLRQAQALAAKGRRSNGRDGLRRNRRNPQRLYTRRMRQLLQELRLSNLNSSCFSLSVIAVATLGDSLASLAIRKPLRPEPPISP